MTFWKSQSFQALQGEWYQRLKDSGFEDAEEVVGTELQLRKRSSKIFSGSRKYHWELKAAYFRQLSERVDSHQFRRPLHEIILRRYADGMTITRIVQELRRKGRYRCRNTICFTIRRYEMLWGLQTYTRKQLNLRDIG